MSEVRFQLLWHEFVLVTPSAEGDAALAYVVQHAHHTHGVVETVRLEVLDVPGGFDVVRNGQPIAHATDLLALVDVVYDQVHTSAFTHASHRGWVRAHAGIVDVEGARVAIAGPSGIGKTTLALRLLFDGAAVQGDESVLVRDGRAFTVARPFHLKDGIATLVPEVDSALAALPTLPVTPPVRAFHPDRVRAWEVSERPIDHVVLVERGPSIALAPVESTSVMHDLVENVFWMHETKSTVVREVAAVLRTARCHRLVVGDVREASSLVQKLGER